MVFFSIYIAKVSLQSEFKKRVIKNKNFELGPSDLSQNDIFSKY